MTNHNKILIVEDDPVQAEFLSLHLNKLGYSIVDTVDNGEKAIEAVKKHSPDLVYMDIFLKGKSDGIEIARQIKTFTNAPVIYITQRDSDEIFNHARDTLPYAYLLKPFTERELQLVTELTLDRYQTESRMQSLHLQLTQAQKLGNMGSWEWNITNNEINWSDQIYRIFGLKPQVFKPDYNAFLERIHPDDRKQVIDAVNDALNDNIPYNVEHRIICPDGTVRFVHETGEITYNDNKPVKMLGTIVDITQRKIDEEKFNFMARHDMLTGLANRVLLLDRLGMLLAQSKRNQQSFSLFFIDLDGFKEVNDNYGHRIGDQLLVKVASCLTSLVRESDTAARIGGDEFVMLINDTQDNHSAEIVANKVLHLLQKNYEISGITLKISASIGIARFPEHGNSSDDLLNNADTAMYQAKQAGKNQLCFYTKTL